MDDYWTLKNHKLSIIPEKTYFEKELFPLPFKVLGYFAQIFYIISFALLTYYSLIGVSSLFAISLPFSALVSLSIITGLTYAMIFNVESNNLIKSFEKYFKDLSDKEFMYRTLYFIVGLLIASFVGVVISMEFASFWPLVFGQTLITIYSLLGGFCHATIFFTNYLEYYENIADIPQSTNNDVIENTLIGSIISFSIVGVFLALFITGPVHVIVAVTVGIASLLMVVYQYLKNFNREQNILYRFVNSIDATIRTYISLLFHALGEGALVIGRSNTIFARLTGFIQVGAEIVTDFSSVNGKLKYFTSTDRMIIVYDDDDRIYKDESFMLTEEIDLDDPENQNKVIRRLNISSVNRYEYKFNPRIQVEGTRSSNSNNSSYSQNTLVALLLFISTCTVVPLFLYFKGFTLFTVLISIPIIWVFCSYINDLLELKPESFLDCILPFSNGIKNTLSNQQNSAFNYKVITGRLFFHIHRIPNSSYRLFAYFLCGLIAYQMSMFIPMPYLTSIAYLNFVICSLILYYPVKEFLTFSIWLLGEDPNQKNADFHNFVNSLLSLNTVFDFLKIIIITTISTCIGIDCGVEFIQHFGSASSFISEVSIILFVVFAWMTEGVFINTKITEFVENQASSSNLVNDISHSDCNVVATTLTNSGFSSPGLH